MPRRAALVVLLALAVLVAAPEAHARSANVAALQVALGAKGLYRGSIEASRGRARGAPCGASSAAGGWPWTASPAHGRVARWAAAGARGSAGA